MSIHHNQVGLSTGTGWAQAEITATDPAEEIDVGADIVSLSVWNPSSNSTTVYVGDASGQHHPVEPGGRLSVPTPGKKPPYIQAPTDTTVYVWALTANI